MDQYRAHVLNSAQNNVAPCQPVWNLYQAMRLLFCRHMMDPLVIQHTYTELTIFFNRTENSASASAYVPILQDFISMFWMCITEFVLGLIIYTSLLSLIILVVRWFIHPSRCVLSPYNTLQSANVSTIFYRMGFGLRQSGACCSSQLSPHSASSWLTTTSNSNKILAFWIPIALSR